MPRYFVRAPISLTPGERSERVVGCWAVSARANPLSLAARYQNKAHRQSIPGGLSLHPEVRSAWSWVGYPSVRARRRQDHNGKRGCRSPFRSLGSPAPRKVLQGSCAFLPPSITAWIACQCSSVQSDDCDWTEIFKKNWTDCHWFGVALACWTSL